MMVALVAMAIGCSKKADPNPASGPRHPEQPSIYTVNYPLSYFAERMAPADARVVFPAPRGTDPAFWKPSADAVQGYQAASLILLNGAGYARWTNYATLPKARIVVTADGCRGSYLRTEQSVRHQHGPEGAHAHAELAFTTWLDLGLATCQSSHIRDALLELMPTAKDSVSAEFEALERDLLDLDERLRNRGQGLGRPAPPRFSSRLSVLGRRIRSFHPEPASRARPGAERRRLERGRCDVEARSRELDAVGGPSPRGHRSRPPRARRHAIVFDPAGQSPSEGDFLSVMKANVARLECAPGVKPCR